DELREAGFALYHTAFLGELAEALGRTRQLADGLSTVDAALAQSARNDERWCVPELLRVKATLLSQRASRGRSSAADACVRRSIAMARRHRALSWELRSSVTLARMRRARQPGADVTALLELLCARFGPHVTTPDLEAARRLLADGRSV